MAEVTERILRLRAEGAESVQDLKQNISALKRFIDQAKVGTDDYNLAVKELEVNQNALKVAMNGSVQSMDEVAEAARGTTESYNGLVAQMKSYKAELRNTDISTEEGKQKFAELATKINDCNDKLKELDAMQGNFQRNVGNYQSAFKGWAEETDAFGKGLDITKGNVNGVKGALDALAKHPWMVVIGIAIALLKKWAEGFKESEQGQKVMQNSLEEFQPVIDTFNGALEWSYNTIADLFDILNKYSGAGGIVMRWIKHLVGVRNALIQYLIAPLKSVVNAIAVLKEKGIAGAKEAALAFTKGFTDGISFYKNYKAGGDWVDQLTELGAERRRKAKKAGKKAGEEIRKGILEALEEGEDDASIQARDEEYWNDGVWNIDRAWEAIEDKIEADKAAEEEEKRHLDELAEANRKFGEAQAEELEKRKEKEDAYKQMRIDSLFAMSDATQSVLGSISDMFETSNKNSETNAKKIKGLRIAEAIINTISGAVGAFMGITKDTGGWGIAAAAAEAAAVTAAGVAQINKIKNTAVSLAGNGATSATVSAPTVKTELPQVRNVNTQTEVDRLNQQKNNRVYVVASDIQASLDSAKTQVSESSF